MSYKVVELGEVAEITKLAGFEFSKYIEYNDSGEIIALRAMNVKNGTLNLENIKRIDKSVSDTLTRSKLYKNDIVMTYTGSNFGDTAIIKENDKFHLAPNIAKITIKDGNNPYFFFSYIRSDYFRQQLNNYVGGSSQPTIPMKTIRKIEVPLPQIQEQEKIANILSSLDDKIELNNEMNKTLEEMAQSIFKRWFVDFEFPNEDGEPYKSSGGEMVDSELGMIPKGWEVKTIGDLCEVGSSKRIFMKEYVDSGVPFYRGKEIIEKSKGNSVSTELFITKERFEEIKEKFGVPNKNDILLTSVGTLGVAYLVGDEDFYFKDGNLTWFKNFKKEAYRYFIYKWIISSEGKKSIDAITIGSTQKALTINALKGMKLIVPSNDILSLFEGFIKSNISNIRSNNEEKNNLIDIRDSLLPKLMSGEISLNNII